VSPVLGTEPSEVTPDGADADEPREPFDVESGPVGSEGDDGGPVGRES
jgi:hypothetical protein